MKRQIALSQIFANALSALFALCASAVLAAPILTGQTSRPSDSTFEVGEPVRLTFTIAALAPGATDQLLLTTRDEHGAVVDVRTVDVRAASDGSWSASVDAPAKRLGFYRVSASLSGGTTLPAQFTRPGGWLTYAVVPPVAQRKDYGDADSLFGLQGSFGAKSIQALPRLGARWVLGGKSWYWGEPHHAGEYKADPNARDVYATDLGDAWRVSRLFSVGGVPKWAGMPETRAAGSQNAQLTSESETAYSAYCKEAARDVVAKFAAEPKHYYQVLWEPVVPWGYKGTDAGLVRISQIAYEAIHSIDPKAVVVGPCGSSMDVPQIAWNERLLRAGIGKYIDAISIHPYVQHPAEEHGYVDNVRAFKAMLRRVTGKDLAIMGTEQGISTNEDIGKELDQAEGIVRQSIISLGEGFEVNYSFYFTDYHMGREKGYGFYYNLDPAKDWGSDFVSPKPVAPAYAAMTLMLDGHRSNGPIAGLHDTQVGYAFERARQIVAAIWDYGKAGSKVTLPVGEAPVQAFDWMGNTIPLAVKDGLVTVSLSGEPVYVKGLPLALFGNDAERRLQIPLSQLEAVPGGNIILQAHVRAASEPGLSMGVSAQGLPNIAIAALSSRDGLVRVPITLPASIAPGEHRMSLVLRGKSGQIEGMAEACVNVQPIVEPVSVQSSATDSGPGMLVHLSSHSRRSESGRVAVSIKEVPSARIEQKFVIDAGATRDVVLPLDRFVPDPLRRYHIRASVSAAGAAEAVCDARLDFLTARKLSSPIDVAGALNEWNPIPPLHIEGKENVVRSPESFAGDVAGDMRFAWDETALYFACSVTSSTHIQPYSGDEIWRGDCLQMAFNLDANKQKAATGNMAADSEALAYSELNFALTSSGPVCTRSITFDPSKVPLGSVAPSDLKYTIVRQGNSTVYEAQIPWRTLGALRAPAPGSSIGIAAAINKIYTANQSDPTALGLYDGIADGKDPSKFGTLLLAPATH